MQWSGTDTIEFHILPETSNGKEIPTITTALKTAQVKSQVDSSFPTDGHTAILNKLNTKLKRIRKRTNIDNLNNPQQKHRLGTVSNILLRCVCVGGGA